ncbi:aminoglycoside phosphotransferase family protein [Rubrobacter indicoceani]|uniref:aminoglycoside phosphotransferase family protein n=1 Tax=Rubrobacter indicoceani TaxID=2051957 RepID=UPI000E5B202C|nr:aminoglycoside phosphotransferase family protein [Rubrobacter indicoceani]
MHPAADRNYVLPPEDTDLVRRDAGIPGLGTLLDPAAFLAALQGALPEAGIVFAEPLYARYKPQMNVLVQYRIYTSDGGEAPVYAKAYGPDAAPHLDKARRKPGVAGLLGAGRFVLGDRNIVVCAFPNDGRLRQLKLLSRADEKEELYRDLDLEVAGKLKTLRYKPERRYVARYSGSGNAVVKFYTPGDYLQAGANAAAFSEVFKTTGPMRLARVIGTSREYGAIAGEWAEGIELDELLRGRADASEVVKLAGAALSELHNQRRVTGLKYTTRQEEANSLATLASGVSFTLPGISGEVYSLVGEIVPRLLACPLLDAPTHGDFYEEQVIVNPADGYVTILDLDRATFGDPASDLGNFLAHLERDVLAGDLDAPVLPDLGAALLDGYSELGGEKSVRERVALYRAAGLLRLAPEPFRRRSPDWPERTRRIVRRVRELLESPPEA